MQQTPLQLPEASGKADTAALREEAVREAV
jgi:hypothetical protein